MLPALWHRASEVAFGGWLTGCLPACCIVVLTALLLASCPCRSGRVDLRQVEVTIQNLIGSGMDPKTENNPYLGFIYTSFQVRAGGKRMMSMWLQVEACLRYMGLTEREQWDGMG